MEWEVGISTCVFIGREWIDGPLIAQRTTFDSL